MSYIGISNGDGTYSLIHSDVDDEVLAHHGILGQRWGVRRYQNADGSLTQLGAKRYHYQTTLNDLDKKSTKTIANYMRTNAKLAKSANKTSKYYEKYEKNPSARNKKKAEKAEKKSIELVNKTESQKKSVKDTDSKIWKTTAAALNSGYDVNAKRVYRNHDNLRTLAGYGAGGVLGVGGAMLYNRKKYGDKYPVKNPDGTVVYQNPMMVQGNKYSVTKPNPLMVQYRTTKQKKK